jgi:hypothetical protein
VVDLLTCKCEKYGDGENHACSAAVLTIRTATCQGPLSAPNESPEAKCNTDNCICNLASVSICMCPCYQQLIACRIKLIISLILASPRNRVTTADSRRESSYDGEQSQAYDAHRSAPGHTAAGNAGDPRAAAAQLCWVGASLPPYAWMPAKAIPQRLSRVHNLCTQLPRVAQRATWQVPHAPSKTRRHASWQIPRSVGLSSYSCSGCHSGRCARCAQSASLSLRFLAAATSREAQVWRANSTATRSPVPDRDAHAGGCNLPYDCGWAPVNRSPHIRCSSNCYSTD